jgi:DNA-binding NarL/FixJ family response regulator
VAEIDLAKAAEPDDPADYDEDSEQEMPHIDCSCGCKVTGSDERINLPRLRGVQDRNPRALTTPAGSPTAAGPNPNRTGGPIMPPAPAKPGTPLTGPEVALLTAASSGITGRAAIAAAIGATPSSTRSALARIGTRLAMPPMSTLTDILAVAVATRRIPPPPRDPDAVAPTLTRREGQVLRGYAAGMSTATVAGRLCLSDDTVKSHSLTLYAKLGVPRQGQGRRQLALIAAYRCGLLAVPKQSTARSAELTPC